MDWECIQADVTLGANTKACAWILDPVEVITDYTDPTLMATRQFSSIRSGTTAAGTGIFAAIGIIAWDGISVATPTPCPGPLTDCNLDWVVRIVGVQPDGTAAGTLLNPNIFDNTHLSKARRRLGNQTGLLVSFETEGGTFAFAIDIRVLIKE